MILPFNPGSGLIVAPTRLFGPSGDIIIRMAIDTGATGTIVSTEERIEARNIAYQDFEAGCLDLPPSARVDGVLGLDFFRDRRLLIDLRIGLVTVD